LLFEQIGETTQPEMKLFTDHLVAKAEQYESDMSGESCTNQCSHFWPQFELRATHRPARVAERNTFIYWPPFISGEPLSTAVNAFSAFSVLEKDALVSMQLRSSVGGWWAST
jgi:hypothetical protein